LPVLGQCLIWCLLFRNDITIFPFYLGLVVTASPNLHNALKKPRAKNGC
jgi:hypothetical protein